MRLPDWLLSVRGFCLVILTMSVCWICIQTGNVEALIGFAAGTVGGYIGAQGNRKAGTQ